RISSTNHDSNMAPATLSEAHAAILHFLQTAGHPVAVELGHEPIPLNQGSYEVAFENGRLTLQAWTPDRNLFRRITGLDSQSKGTVNLKVARFGSKAGTLSLIDIARSTTGKLTVRASRHNNGQQFRRFLQRQYPSWRIAELSSDPDLEHSLSPAYPRALLRRGSAGIAAVSAPPGGDVDGALTFALIWLDYLRKRERTITVEALTLLLPGSREAATCHRIRQLDRTRTAFTVFAALDGWEVPVDIEDAGNIGTQLATAGGFSVLPAWLEPVAGHPAVERVCIGDSLSLRVRGLEFARCCGTDVRFGISGKRHATPRHAREIAALVTELAAVRCAGGHGQNPLYAAAPERWLESVVRSGIEKVDARLLPAPVYTQTPGFASAERGVIDLLALTLDGQLTVVELKAEEDPHLPLQALEYQARVQWHLERGEFEEKGYFSGQRIRRVRPRVLLVAPAMHFHPTTEIILSFFPPTLEIERIGLSAGWRSEPHVVSRLL
ncbi:MAG TPA: hypothetical protein VES20_12735, partial [Bryobacteraceae bacterium]|nr:hypothetical protein [Bryobacteraceae bacterium]